MTFRTSSPQLLLCCVGFAFGLSACNINLNVPDQVNANQAPESAYCGAAQAKTYTGSVTNVSGNAKFEYRALDLTSMTCNGLCGNPVANRLPIYYAEINIVDSSGTVIQCAETDGSGNFTNLKIPATAGTYTLKVNSRSYTNAVKASVLEDIYSANPYTISTSFTIATGASSVSGLALVAPAQTSVNPKIPGGAFNILADIYWANQFLRAQSGDSSFVADKTSLFWKAGFNPYSYFGSPNALASFFVSSENRLYILGGNNGDVKSTDTDHFDDSVILHEYGHFLEYRYGHSDSPGGSHNGRLIIDPRLAWSEGWANYFQGAVLDTIVYATSGGPKGSTGFSKYVDTIGFKADPVEGSGSSAGLAFAIDLTQAASTASFDSPGTDEGIFREFSISRTLFKTFRASIPFTAVWSAFTSLNDVTTPVTPPHKFINFGLFNYQLNSRITDSTQNTNWQSILTEEKQKRDTTLYGDTLNEQTASPSCPTVTMQPVIDVSNGYPRSNQLMSNDFYTYKHDGTSKTLTLSYSTGASGSDIADLNLYLYADGYLYSEEYQEAQAGFSNSTLLYRSKTINISSNTQTETIDLSGLPAGYYMINVKAATLGKLSSDLDTATAIYYLYAGGKCLVPN